MDAQETRLLRDHRRVAWQGHDKPEERAAWVPFMRPALAALLLLAPLAGAQDHDHAMSNGVAIAHDVAPDGHTYVGNLNHFVVLYLGDDAEPDFHQQNHVRVSLDNSTVFETTPDSGHDYDGMYGFDVVFGRPGDYAVEVLQDGAVVASFGGTVHPHQGNLTGHTPLTVPDTGLLTGPSGPYKLVYGAGLPDRLFSHSDAVLEVFSGPENADAGGMAEVGVQSQALVLRVKTHTHHEEQSVRLMLDEPEVVFARVSTYLSYPEKGGVEFAPSSTVAEILHNGHTFVPEPPGSAIGSGVVPANVVVAGSAGPEHVLLGTYDPYDTVGPRTLQHLGIAVLDPMSHMPVQHVDFEATLRGPLGNEVFYSDTLHEYDGILEFESVQTVPGVYTLLVDAKRGNWTGHIELPYTVAANPIGTLGAGPQVVTLAADDGITAGQPTHFEFRVADAAGNAFQHGEIDLIVERLERGQEDDPYAFGLPVLRAKLHTHASGTFAFDFAFPDAGNYVLRALPYSLGLTATPTFYGGAFGGGHLVFPVTVAPGTPWAAETEDGTSEDERLESPGMPAVLALLALAFVAAARRRRS
jgi:hypothetical protein